jgi:hypothetical protein
MMSRVIPSALPAPACNRSKSSRRFSSAVTICDRRDSAFSRSRCKSATSESFRALDAATLDGVGPQPATSNPAIECGCGLLRSRARSTPGTSRATAASP